MIKHLVDFTILLIQPSLVLHEPLLQSAEVGLLGSHGSVVLLLLADILYHVLCPVNLPVVGMVLGAKLVAFLQQPLVLLQHNINVTLFDVPYLLAGYLHQVQLLGHPLPVLQQLLVLVAGALLLHTSQLADVLPVQVGLPQQCGQLLLVAGLLY